MKHKPHPTGPLARPTQGGERRLVPTLTAALVAAGLLSPTAMAQVQKAGDLLVDVDATSLAEGTLPTIPNSGTLHGLFEARGGEGTVPVIATEGGTKGIRFDGTDFMQLVDAAGGALITAPAGITGESPTRSIEAWVLNPSVPGEDTIVSWGKRGGPDGSNLSFGFGSDFRWGAVGHWGGDGPDLGWDNNGGSPSAGQWHHLVYTFDGTASKVYSDGAYINGETVTPGIIVTHPDTAISLATQLESDGETPTANLRGTLTLARLRIHDGVLTAEQVAANYTLEKAAFINPLPPAPPTPARLTKGPVHRYSFSDSAAANATGLEFKDSIGTAHGKVVGDGAELTGSRLRLVGGSSATQAYGDLPNGLVSQNGVANGGSGEFTLETWIKVTGGRTWSRVFDIGSSTSPDTNGELDAPGGGGEGRDYFAYTAQIDGDVNSRRLEIRNEDPAGGGVATLDVASRGYNTDSHVVVTWSEKTKEAKIYENGVALGTLAVDDLLSDMNDVNVWLGRSNWTGDQNTQGEYDEVRLYDTALTQAQAIGNFDAGPDLINDRDVAVVVQTPPSSATVPETLPATFRVVARGSSPVSYQWFRNGAAIPGATASTYSLATTTAADNGAAFTVEVSNIVNGTPVKQTTAPATLTVSSDTVTLKHRYSFTETSGTKVTDSVGTAHGETLGNASFGGGQLALDGSDGTYVNLPNGIITALGDNGTIEMWVTYDGGPNWSRVFDFGANDAGEDAVGGGTDFLFYTARSGPGFPRFEANFPDAGTTTTLNHPGSMPIGQQEHVAITYSFSGNTARLYTNGVVVGSAGAPTRLSAMNNLDVNNWLGRSQFNNDAFWAGKYNEFRIYSGSLTPSQVAASFAAGPDNLPAPPAATPKLTVTRGAANAVVVTWPSSAEGFTLEASNALGSAAAWTAVGTGTPAAGGVFTVTVPATETARFLRLRR
ncbi:MAG: hypothetical protein IT580_10650 [Verrucomicrobiales bacterium]|nr:hypothetical protein [Verrucomicrobiales bacterium]